MNYSDFIAATAEKAGTTKAETKALIEAATAVISDALTAKEPVVISGFGNFAVKETKAKTGRNPATGGTIEIPAKTKAVFKPAKALADRVNA